MPSPPRLEETRPTGHGRARGLVSSRTSGRRIESKTFAPPESLRDMVECFWVGRWDLPADAPHVTELLGDPAHHVCFEEGSSRIVGVWTHLWRRELAGRGQVRAAKIRVGAARRILPSPAFRYTNAIAPIGSVFATPPMLEAEVLAPAEDEVAFARFAAWLEASRSPPQLDPHEIELAVAAAQRIANDTTLTRVENLAFDLGLEVRDLQRIFRLHVGATPKHVLRRMRLQEVALRLERGEAVPLARLAAELGYADHAHLTRDFKAATGRTPTTFRRDVWR